MKLQSLSASFIRREVRIVSYSQVKPHARLKRVPLEPDDVEEIVGPREYLVFVERIEEADGLYFLCPKCFQANGGPVNTHSVICWFVGKVADDVDPKPGRWTPQGTALHDLTFVPSQGRSQSVLLTSGCRWHGLIVNGDATV